VWPLIVLLIRPFQLPWLLAAGETLVICVRSWLVFHSGASDAIDWTRVDGLLLGAAAATVIRNTQLSRRMKSLMPFLAVLPLAIFLGYYGFRHLWREDAGLPLLQAVGFPLFAFAFALLLLAAASTDGERNWLQSILCLRFLTWTGKYSYGLYVFHYPLEDYLEALSARNLRVILGFLLSYGIAFLSYNYFEKRFLRLKDRFRSRAAAPVPQALSAP